MPRYDFRCDGGHVTECSVERSVTTVLCRCGSVAGRLPAVPSIAGTTIQPMSARYVPLNQAREAHDEIVYAAEKAGVQAPDLITAGRRQAALRRKYRPETIGE